MVGFDELTGVKWTIELSNRKEVILTIYSQETKAIGRIVFKNFDECSKFLKDLYDKIPHASFP